MGSDVSAGVLDTSSSVRLSFLVSFFITRIDYSYLDDLLLSKLFVPGSPLSIGGSEVARRVA